MRRPRGRARRGFVALLRSLVPAKKRRARRRRVRLRGRLHLPGPFSIAAGLVLGGVILAAVVGAGRIAGIGPGGRTDLRPPEGLPSLPVLPQQFAGVTLERYLRPPAVHVDHVDALLSSPVLADAEFTEAVHWWVTYWTVYATRWFPGYLERMADRGEDVDRAVLAYGFPPSLRYLPLIESGYDPRVTSRSGAVGLWQLMPTTARGLGLTVSPVLDERRDADKYARRAALHPDAEH